jgi:hypothetical protein
MAVLDTSRAVPGISSASSCGPYKKYTIQSYCYLVYPQIAYIGVHHLNKIDSDRAAVAVREVCRVVDQHRHFFGSDFASSVAKDKED